MFMFTHKNQGSRIGRALERMVERRGLKRHRNDRAQSVPPRQSPSVVEPLTDSPNLTAGPLPIASRGRSASCTALDWFAGGLTWSDVEASGYLMRSGSYRSVEHEGPVLDMRHDCVKARSPTVVAGQHEQNSPTAVTPLTAELVAVRNSTTTAGRSAPPPTPVEGIRDGETSHASVDNDRVDVMEELAIRRHLQRPLLSVDIPEGSMSPPAEAYQMLWGKF